MLQNGSSKRNNTNWEMEKEGNDFECFDRCRQIPQLLFNDESIINKLMLLFDRACTEIRLISIRLI